MLCEGERAQFEGFGPESVSLSNCVYCQGEGAVLIRFGTDIDIDVNTRVLAYMSSLDKTDRLNGEEPSLAIVFLPAPQRWYVH